MRRRGKGFFGRRASKERLWRQRACDVLVHVNALLPCAIVYYTLKVLKSVWFAVFLYESVCLLGLPWLTVMLRGPPEKNALLTRVRPLLRSLVSPWNRCVETTTGAVLVFGFGGFFTYLAVAQREFDEHGISAAISKHSNNTGLRGGTPSEDLALIFLGVWFCTINPILEELFWRGYLYAELGRIINAKHASLPIVSSSETDEDDDLENLDHCSIHNLQGDSSSQDHKSKSLLLESKEQSTFTRWLLSFYFGSFHGVVVFVFVDVAAALAVCLFLAVCSRLWIYLAERPPFGFPFIVAFHAGADLAVVLALSACDFGWAKREAYVAALIVTFCLGTLGIFLLALAWKNDHLPCYSTTSRSSSSESLLDETTSTTSSSMMSSMLLDNQQQQDVSSSSRASGPSPRTSSKSKLLLDDPSSSSFNNNTKKKSHSDLPLVPTSLSASEQRGPEML